MGILQSSEPLELPESLRWEYTKITPGIKGPFMLAGPPLAFYCHHPVKRTYPCLTRLKGCTLSCPWCRFRTQYTSYVPLFDLIETNPRKQKIVVCGGKKTWEDVNKFKVGEVVAITRGTGETDTNRFRPWPNPVDVNDLNRWRRRLIDDISPYLFHLWQYRPLTEHFGQRYIPSLAVQANAVPHPTARDETNPVE